ncbi:MAG TPA: adenylosuccinate lyase [Thermoanaerobaculia bacterium]|nr:adenylosuccinate lyase [Thermoanaerobaculia bacterium]
MLDVLRDRYATREMAVLFSPERRYGTWRELWLVLARSQRELGLPITEEQIWGLEEAAGRIDLERVAEIERETRHDVVAHLRHFAEQATAGGGILHLGATSAYITDNTDVLLQREALRLVRARLLSLAAELAAFARRTSTVPTLAYTHFQPAQLTTIGKRACLWLQDVMEDLAAVEERLGRLRCRGVKGTTGTQASFLTLFDGDHERVEELDRRVAQALGFEKSWAVTGQTYPRKQDSQVLAALAGAAETCHKLGTDLRLLQGVGELAEPFGDAQVGSSAMAYKRNPVRAERMCGLARRLLTDALNGPLNAATQWLERSLDDSANRRLVLEDAFLTCDAILHLAAGIVRGLTVHETVVAARVARELPFMATETLLMEAVVRGGDRQELHERLRRYSLEAQEEIAHGRDNPLIGRIAADADFRMTRDDIAALLDPRAFVGRAAEQVASFLAADVDPVLVRERETRASVEEPRV